MARTFNKSERRSGSRRQKPIIAIVAEGRNETETKYFNSFRSQDAGYIIKVLPPKSTTDPVGMQRRIEKWCDDNDLSQKKGDLAYIVTDLDCSKDKATLIKQLSEQNSVSRFIISNPCFEVWFLLHFRYSTKQYQSSEAVVKNLRNFVPGYEKSMDIKPVIENSTDRAMENAMKLEQHFSELGYDWPSEACNPRTDVPRIIDAMRALDALA